MYKMRKQPSQRQQKKLSSRPESREALRPQNENTRSTVQTALMHSMSRTSTDETPLPVTNPVYEHQNSTEVECQTTSFKSLDGIYENKVQDAQEMLTKNLLKYPALQNLYGVIDKQVKFADQQKPDLKSEQEYLDLIT